jgi:hypothetical protein
MTIATDWRVTLKVSASIKAKFEEDGSVNSASSAAKRTNAKFLIACVMEIITILVIITRAMINPHTLL